ncbi:hypothetical protein [Sulfurovum sp. AR]|uniref:hypothetical protein n=1 Tax=Sulfurovum sp. AR TaxID=1165841 RepID=UPI00025C4F8E|nr:hypothetical protein [Sulfurovum sp. AR]EIF51189.1 hypothetical protein SULAR_04843 [Sulfurovum sp. AR]
MGARENDNRSEGLRFNGKDIQLAVKMLDKLEATIDIIYYLMENENQQAFVLMLLTAKDVDLNTLLDREKRETDILFEIDKEEPLYVMLCQDTKVDGGYRFAERLIRNIQLDKGSDIFCTELEVRATHYTPKQVILKLLETFAKSKLSNKSNEIVFRSLQ